jgi:chromate transporter
MIAVASGIPGSDAVQMAIQVGYHVNGFVGASVALVGALLPCILLVFLTYVGFQFVDQAILAKFFKGINPALSVTLVVTAFGLFKPSGDITGLLIVAITAGLLFVGTPLPILLLAAGFIGVYLY